MVCGVWSKSGMVLWIEMEEWLRMLTWGAAVERAIHQRRNWTSGYRFGEAKNPGPANRRTAEDEIRFLLTNRDAPVWQILEVAPDSTMEERKRQYYVKMFKVHPDDCQHPQAQAAVHIVGQTWPWVHEQARRPAPTHSLLKPLPAKQKPDKHTWLHQEYRDRLWRMLRKESTCSFDSRRQVRTTFP